MTLLGAAGILAAAALAGPAAARPAGDDGAGTTTVQSHAYLPPGDMTVDCSTGRGGACFSLPAGTTKVWATMVDDLTTGTAAEIYFQDASSGTIGEPHPFCGSSAKLAVPAGAVQVMVTADEVIFNTLDDHCAATSIATAGTATLSSFVPLHR
jgi:hypothetical protein